VMRMTLVPCVMALVVGCATGPSPEAAKADSVTLHDRQARLEQALAEPDSSKDGKPVARWNLPGRLQEISGLVLTADGRLLTHGDERGKVFEVDFRRGVVLKEFTLGSPAVHGDFESIAIVGDSVLLLTSDGILYRFREGANNSVVEFTKQDTGLGASCEFESMVYEKVSASLLLACKREHDKAFKDSLVIFRLPLTPGKDGKPGKVTHLSIPVASIIGSNDWSGFRPSDMTIDPFNGNYLMIDAREKGIVEVTPKGAVIFARPLPPGHAQPEGIAITSDHLLLISDEAKGGAATITLYRWP
jgi:uncharacterized protein YjiK